MSTQLPSHPSAAKHCAPAERPASPSFWLLVGTTSLAFVTSQLDVTIVNVALPRIGEDFAVDVAGLQWVVDAYTLALAACMLAAGSLGDRYGVRRAFRFGLALFALGSAACGAAQSDLALNLARVLQGVGAAAMLPNSLALLNNALEEAPDRRARALGWWTAAGSVSIAAGPVVGGVLLASVGWRSIFWINVPLSILGLLLSSRLAEAPPYKNRERLDVLGQVSSSVALVAITGAVIQWRRLGPEHPVVWGGLALGILFGAAFILVERRASAPMLPLELFRIRRFSAAVVFGMIVNFTYYGTLFILTLHFQQSLGYSALATGLAFLPLTAGFFFSNVASGRLVVAFGARVPMMLGAAIDLAGFGLLARIDAAAPYPQFFIPFLLIPAGMGLAVPAMTSTVLAAVPRARAATASAVLNTARQAAGALGVACFGALAHGGPGPVARTLGAVVAASIVLLAIAIATAALITPGLRQSPRG